MVDYIDVEGITFHWEKEERRRMRQHNTRLRPKCTQCKNVLPHDRVAPICKRCYEAIAKTHHEEHDVSHVTNVIVTSLCGSSRIRDLLSELGFNQVDRYAGGNITFEMDLYAAAFNNASMEDLKKDLQRVRSADETVQAWVNSQSDDRFYPLID